MDTLEDNNPLPYNSECRRRKPGLKDRFTTGSQSSQPPAANIPDDGHAERLPQYQ